MRFMRKSYRILLICSLLLTGCAASDQSEVIYNDEDASSDAEFGEEKVDLSTANVQVTEDDYQQIQEIREELKNVILYKKDSKKLSQLIDLTVTEDDNLKESDLWSDGSLYLSSIPLIEWDCQKNCINEIKLPLFSKDMSKFVFLGTDYADGKINYEYGGFESVDVDTWQEHPNRKYALLKAGRFTSCMIDQNNRIYLAEDHVTVPEHFCDRFDFDLMGASFNQMTASDACVKVDLDN